MSSRLKHYTDEEISQQAPFWRFLYRIKMPLYSDDEVDAFIFHYKCPPWRWPVPMLYKGLGHGVESEKIRAERERHTIISTKEALELARKRIMQHGGVKKHHWDEDDPVRWTYLVSVPERRKWVKIR